MYTTLDEVWSGSLQPFRCSVFLGGTVVWDDRGRASVEGGRWIGRTGGCSSPGRAREASHNVIAKFERKQKEAP